jgi:elongation factor Ts
MAEITAALVKELREKTGAGMMDCKKALAETSGDLENAVDWLRKKGLAAAAKKAGRVAAEGLVGVATQGKVGAVVEVNSETDFVARNEGFQSFVKTATEQALKARDVEALKTAPAPGGGMIADTLTNLVAKIGENMSIRRMARLEVGQGAVISYVHNALTPGLGKIGVLVALESTAPADKLAEFGKQLAMHVAAANPQFLDLASVDKAAVDRERQVLIAQAKQDPKSAGKPDDIIGKMVEGRLRKFYEDVVLTEQVFVIDGETRVSKVIDAAGKTAGAPVKVAGFARFALGEGIEKAPAGDFAAEVAAQLKH